jgi:hypothetical protein
MSTLDIYSVRAGAVKHGRIEENVGCLTALIFRRPAFRLRATPFEDVLRLIECRVDGIGLRQRVRLHGGSRALGSLFGHYVEFAIRPLLIIMLVVTSLVVVMLSAHFPARRAASINAIEAIIAPWLRDCSTRAPTQPLPNGAAKRLRQL